MTLFSAENLSITFEGPLYAVQEVSFAIEPGEMVGLIGESGSGKTAIANAAMGFLPKGATVEGAIKFQGNDLLTLSPKDRQNIRGKSLAMIFQDPQTALNPVLSIGAQLIEAVRIHKKIPKNEAAALCISLLEKVGITDSSRRMRQYPHELSGGLRQRILIAMALVHAPDLVIADELTTALDTLTKKKLASLLRELQKSFSSAFLIISHDLAFVKEITSKICVLYSGKICEITPTKELFTNPRHPYTQALLEALPAYALEKDLPLRSIAGSIPQPTPKHRGCPFAGRCPHTMAACKEKPPELGPGQVACILEEAHV